jgi:hypothetical protein
MKYGDAVTFVQKSSDGTVRRLNAIVLATAAHVALTADRKPVPDADASEHLDIAFPVPTLVPEGQVLKTRNVEEVFRLAYDVAPYVEGAWVGYESASIRTAEGFSLPPLGDLTSSESLTAAPVATFPVPTEALLALSGRIQTYGPELLVSPDAVVPSACMLIDTLIGDIAEAEGQLTRATDTMGELNQKVLELQKQAGKPSAADLDADAAEKEATAATDQTAHE